MKKLIFLLVFLTFSQIQCSDSNTNEDAGLDTNSDTNDDSSVNTDALPSECENDVDCSDYVYCNGVERCDDGVCIPGITINCDDNVSCTEDKCNEQTNTCIHLVNNILCDDNNPCNGVERCSPGMTEADENGCIEGVPFTCLDDGDECTEEYCDEETGECGVRIKDLDNDEFGDSHCNLCDENGENCVRGTDCNDSNFEINPDVPEFCGDGIDNNCNKLVDYADGCFIPNDSCATAQEIVEEVSYPGSLIGSTADIPTGCDNDEALDVVYYFVLNESRDVFINFDGVADTFTAILSSSCGTKVADLKCNSGTTYQMKFRDLAAGTYFLVVSAGREANFSLSMETREPTQRPVGDVCLDAVDVSSGGTFNGTTTGSDHDYELTCGQTQGYDISYKFTLNKEQSFNFNASAEDHTPISVALQSECGVNNTQRFCMSGEEVSLALRTLDPGNYYLIFQHEKELNFNFDINFGEPVESTLSPELSTQIQVNSVTKGDKDDGQYNINIAPLSFPFNSTTYSKIALSTNGYIRFGQTDYPDSICFMESCTDVSQAYVDDIAQISFLGQDAKIEDYISYTIDEVNNRVVISVKGLQIYSTGNPYEKNNHIQIILFCDTGDIQISYIDCTFDKPNSDFWSIGISEPDRGDYNQQNDFTNQPWGSSKLFFPGVLYQSPGYSDPSDYMRLNGNGILFVKKDDGWEVFVDRL